MMITRVRRTGLAVVRHRPILRTSTSWLVNDVHSQLNETSVSRVVDVGTVPELQQAVRAAVAAGQQISIAGGRHAMGGQQFGTGTVLLDVTRMSRVIDLDSERGLVLVLISVNWLHL